MVLYPRLFLFLKAGQWAGAPRLALLTEHTYIDWYREICIGLACPVSIPMLGRLCRLQVEEGNRHKAITRTGEKCAEAGKQQLPRP